MDEEHRRSDSPWHFSTNKRGDFMKKTFTAVAGAIATLGWASSAHAQSNVTIYGLLDAAVTAYSTSAGTRLPGGAGAAMAKRSGTQLDSGVGPGSRLGFRGQEDLGGGLHAKFVLESGIGVDTGGLQQGGLAFGRQAFVGIGSGKAWSLTAGRQYSPMNAAFALATPTYGFYWGGVQTNSGYPFWPSVGEAPGSGFFQGSARVDNSILFSGTMGAFTGELMIGLGNENARQTGRLINPAITYASGPLTLRASYARHKQGAAGITATAEPEWLSQYIVGGSYKFGWAELFTGVHGAKGPKNAGNLSAAATLGSPTANLFAYSWQEERSVWFGARVPLGSGTLLASIGRNKFEYATGPDGESTALLLGYEYPLSKRTVLYGNFGSIRNNAHSNSPLSATVSVLPASGFNSDVKATSFGIRHAF
ncbi:porin [Hydrogenophaga sp. YM1]|uniref:porin n=1 Tax=Hydrogenophaga sp. YM1 TaxID=2806262 RepID=UPI00195F0065|nr:porin [Hydrogenophaga sp. YM1]QRR33996.1 porin [Hydrogenophaga sp. YM1]